MSQNRSQRSFKACHHRTHSSRHQGQKNNSFMILSHALLSQVSILIIHPILKDFSYNLPIVSDWVKVLHLCLTLCVPVDYTVHGILQARVLEWVAFHFSRGSSQPQGLNGGLAHCRRVLYELSHKGHGLNFTRKVGKKLNCGNLIKDNFFTVLSLQSQGEKVKQALLNTSNRPLQSTSRNTQSKGESFSHCRGYFQCLVLTTLLFYSKARLLPTPR